MSGYLRVRANGKQYGLPIAEVVEVVDGEMYEDAQNFFQKTLALGPNLIEAYYEMGRAQWYAEEHDAARETWARGFKANKLTTWGKRCKEALELIERGEEPLP